MWQKVCLILTRSLRAREKGSRQKQHLGSRGSYVVTSNSPMPCSSDTEANKCCQVSPETHAASPSPNTDIQGNSSAHRFRKGTAPAGFEGVADRPSQCSSEKWHFLYTIWNGLSCLPATPGPAPTWHQHSHSHLQPQAKPDPPPGQLNTA